MSGIGFSELVVLFVIGLLILGPERLPRVATQVGRWVGRARRTANQLRYQLEREIALADIEKKPKRTEDARPDESKQQRSEDASQEPVASEAAAEPAVPENTDGGDDAEPASEDETR